MLQVLDGKQNDEISVAHHRCKGEMTHMRVSCQHKEFSKFNLNLSESSSGSLISPLTIQIVCALAGYSICMRLQYFVFVQRSKRLSIILLSFPNIKYAHLYVFVLCCLYNTFYQFAVGVCIFFVSKYHFFSLYTINNNMYFTF